MQDNFTSVNFWLIDWLIDWLCWGLMTCQPLWVILCCLPEKGRNFQVFLKEMSDCRYIQQYPYYYLENVM